MIGVPTGDGLALGGVQRGDDAGERRGQLDGGLHRLDLDDGLVDLDGVADRDRPLQDVALGQALAEVGQLELLDSALDGLSTPGSVDGVEDAVEVGQPLVLEAARRVRGVVAGHPQHRRLEGVERLLGAPGRRSRRRRRSCAAPRARRSAGRCGAPSRARSGCPAATRERRSMTSSSMPVLGGDRGGLEQRRHHRPVAGDRDVLARAHDAGLVQRGRRRRRPRPSPRGSSRLGSKKITGSSSAIGLLDHPVGVGRVRAGDDLQPGGVREVGLGRFAVVLDRADAAAERDADRDRHPHLAGRAVVELRDLADDLVEAGEDEAVELDLAHRPVAADRQADRGADDRRTRPAGCR